MSAIYKKGNNIYIKELDGKEYILSEITDGYYVLLSSPLGNFPYKLIKVDEHGNLNINVSTIVDNIFIPIEDIKDKNIKIDTKRIDKIKFIYNNGVIETNLIDLYECFPELIIEIGNNKFLNLPLFMANLHNYLFHFKSGINKYGNYYFEDIDPKLHCSVKVYDTRGYGDCGKPFNLYASLNFPPYLTENGLLRGKLLFSPYSDNKTYTVREFSIYMYDELGYKTELYYSKDVVKITIDYIYFAKYTEEYSFYGTISYIPFGKYYPTLDGTVEWKFIISHLLPIPKFIDYEDKVLPIIWQEEFKEYKFLGDSWNKEILFTISYPYKPKSLVLLEQGIEMPQHIIDDSFSALGKFVIKTSLVAMRPPLDAYVRYERFITEGQYYEINIEDETKCDISDELPEI